MVRKLYFCACIAPGIWLYWVSKAVTCWGGSGCAGNGSPVWFCVFVGQILHGPACSCSRAAKELKLLSQLYCWKLLDLAPSHRVFHETWPCSSSKHPQHCSTLVQALLGVLHFIAHLKIPSQITSVGYFEPLFVFDSFTSIGQTYWMEKFCRYYGD